MKNSWKIWCTECKGFFIPQLLACIYYSLEHNLLIVSSDLDWVHYNQKMSWADSSVVLLCKIVLKNLLIFFLIFAFFFFSSPFRMIMSETGIQTSLLIKVKSVFCGCLLSVFDIPIYFMLFLFLCPMHSWRAIFILTSHSQFSHSLRCFIYKGLTHLCIF